MRRDGRWCFLVFFERGILYLFELLGFSVLFVGVDESFSIEDNWYVCWGGKISAGFFYTSSFLVLKDVIHYVLLLF